MVLSVLTDFFDSMVQDPKKEPASIDPLMEHFRRRRRRRRRRRSRRRPRRSRRKSRKRSRRSRKKSRKRSRRSRRKSRRRSRRSRRSKRKSRRRSRRSKRKAKRSRRKSRRRSRRSKRKSRRRSRKQRRRSRRSKRKQKKRMKKIAKKQVKKQQLQKPVPKKEVQRAANNAIPQPVEVKPVDLSVREQPLKKPTPIPKNKFAHKLMKGVFGTLLGLIVASLGFFGYFKWVHDGPYPTWMPLFLIGVFSDLGIKHAMSVPEMMTPVEIDQTAEFNEAYNQYNNHMNSQLTQPIMTETTPIVQQ